MMSDASTVYAGPKAAGTDNPARVIFQYTDAKTAKSCGAVVHHVSVNGDFISCTLRRST